MISAPSFARSGSCAVTHWLFSSIGKKTIVALSGIVLVAYVIGHLLGNLTIFLGPSYINAYAKKLHDLGPMLWAVRIGLLGIVGAHIFFTMLIWKENEIAKPKKYLVSNPIQTSVFARTMRLSGLIVLAFIVFHLAHFTLQVVDPSYQDMQTMIEGHGVRDVYAMVITGFRSGVVVAIYLAGLFFLTFHLSHGISSLFQTLGITNKTLRPFLDTGSRIFAWLLFVGYASIPISIFVFDLGKGIVK